MSISNQKALSLDPSELNHYQLTLWLATILVVASVMLIPGLSEAATSASPIKGDVELTGALGTIKGLVAGTVGKIIATVSFAFGLIASTFKFNPAAIAGSFGVALTAGLGPKMIEAVVGATF